MKFITIFVLLLSLLLMQCGTTKRLTVKTTVTTDKEIVAVKDTTSVLMGIIDLTEQEEFGTVRTININIPKEKTIKRTVRKQINDNKGDVVSVIMDVTMKSDSGNVSVSIDSMQVEYPKEVEKTTVEKENTIYRVSAEQKKNYILIGVLAAFIVFIILLLIKRSL